LRYDVADLAIAKPTVERMIRRRYSVNFGCHETLDPTDVIWEALARSMISIANVGSDAEEESVGAPLKAMSWFRVRWHTYVVLHRPKSIKYASISRAPMKTGQRLRQFGAIWRATIDHSTLTPHAS